MKLLLDTNALLWLLNDDARLGQVARQFISNAESIAVSEISLWEISIKITIGKLKPVPELLDTIQKLRFQRLSLSDNHLRQYETLPLLHRDPFDRMLVAQAGVEACGLVTSDTFLKNYGIEIISTR